MSPNYSNTIIYRVSCRNPEVPDSYLGYTTFTLLHVYKMLEARCKTKDPWFFCEFVRAHGGIKNWFLERLESEPCLTSHDARIELRKHFDADPPTLNRHLPTRTAQEYAKTDKNREVQRLYRQEHPEQIHQEQKKQYEKNKERILIKRRAYYLANRELCNERVRQLRARRKAAELEAIA